ncbi:hypothetical protein FQN57_006132 [Myotisia sp. PD_48]|nr:hypothetical protein FQN57_006132 [Myotisia sp. PD_48]
MSRSLLSISTFRPPSHSRQIHRLFDNIVQKNTRGKPCILCQYRRLFSSPNTRQLHSSSLVSFRCSPSTSSPSTRTISTNSGNIPTAGSDPSSPLAPTPVTPDITNHYTIFPRTLSNGLPPASPFKIPLPDLRREFLALQSLVHPDKFPSGTPKQRAEAISARINEAYRTLSDPLSRAQYILAYKHGIDVTAEDGAQAHPQSPETLMQVLEVQEAVEEAEDESIISELKVENEHRVENTVGKMAQAFDSGDVTTATKECLKLRFCIIHSPQFTFLIGPEHTKLTIQSGLAKHVSPKLDELMNNGHTRESRHHIAVLEEEDVETFVGFCEFAYTGDYTVPPRSANAAKKDSSKSGNVVSFAASVPPPAPSPPSTPKVGAERPDSSAILDDNGEADGDFVALKSDPSPDEADEAKDATDSGKKSKKNKKDKRKKGSKFTEEDNVGATLTPPRTPPPVLAEQFEDSARAEEKDEAAVKDSALDFFDANPSQTSPKQSPEPGALPRYSIPPSRPDGVSLWDEFTTIQYPILKHQSPFALPPPTLPASGPNSNLADPYILFHAKLHTFASRYMIPTLAQLTLTKLHQDLISFPLRSAPVDEKLASNVPFVLELLHYTFTSTSRDDPVFPPSTPARENRLRKLVTHYTACRVREMASYQPVPGEFSFKPVGATVPGNGPIAIARRTPFTFRDLLDSLGELASDLIFRMM